MVQLPLVVKMTKNGRETQLKKDTSGQLSSKAVDEHDMTLGIRNVDTRLDVIGHQVPGPEADGTRDNSNEKKHFQSARNDSLLLLQQQVQREDH